MRSDNWRIAQVAENDFLDIEKPIDDLERQIDEIESNPSARARDLKVLDRLREDLESLKREIYAQLAPYERVLIARYESRPGTLDYISLMFDDFLELHGGRAFKEDRAIITGLGTIGGRRVLLVGHEKGRATRDKVARQLFSGELIKGHIDGKCVDDPVPIR